MQKGLLDEYEAALLVGMSPDLLRWLTGHTVKMNDSRKLKIASKKGSRLYFDKSDLVDYDKWLRQA